MQKLFSIILIIFSLLTAGVKGVSCDDTFFVGESAASERVTDMTVDSLGVVEKTAGAGKVVYKVGAKVYPSAKAAFAIMSRIKPHIIY